MTSVAPPTPENRLARETSPYLLQHKDNPVQWWAWGRRRWPRPSTSASGSPSSWSPVLRLCHLR